MSSRFVPAGTDQNPTTGGDDWTKARQEVENQQNSRPIEKGKQEDGKSLYDVLQANKAAKQDAFEEVSRLRNQFRSLDDSEIEFLDSVRESERLKETSVRQETAEQLELFRKQQLAAEQTAADPVNENKDTDRDLKKALWTALKKRRRDKNETDILPSKSRKQISDQAPEPQRVVASASHSDVVLSPSRESLSKAAVSRADRDKVDSCNKPAVCGLGLSVYASDDDSD